jgi:hypothetical protein
MSAPRRDLSAAAVIPRLPDAFDSARRGDAIPPDIIGATILSFGAAPSELHLEGGGLIVDYIPKGATEANRLVLAFNDCGMWIER